MIKKIIKSLSSFFLLVLFLFLLSDLSNAHADEIDTPCTDKDMEYAHSWGDYYSPDEAYLFGIKIQKLVLSKDLEGLSKLIDETGSYPHRVETLLSRSFDEHFHQEWIDTVLQEPECRPIGWRGFLLGNGRIWYGKSIEEHDPWGITAINYPKKNLLYFKELLISKIKMLKLLFTKI